MEAPTGNVIDWMIEQCRRLLPLRDIIVDWVLLESEINPNSGFHHKLIELLAAFRLMDKPPKGANRRDERLGDPFKIFHYELFLYIVASLAKRKADNVLFEIFTARYPDPVRDYANRFDRFYASSPTLGTELRNSQGQTYISASAEIVFRQATRKDLRFVDLVEAEAIILMMVFVTPEARWYPGTLHYFEYHSGLPFFKSASTKTGYKRIERITGESNPDQLRARIFAGQERIGASHWHNFWSDQINGALNTEKLGTEN